MPIDADMEPSDLVRSCLALRLVRRNKDGSYERSKTPQGGLLETDEIKSLLHRISDPGFAPSSARESSSLKRMLRRGFVAQSVPKSYAIARGERFGAMGAGERMIAEITPEFWALDDAEEVTIKPYKLAARGAPLTLSGVLHPLFRLRSLFREIFLEMGFQETETSRFLESSFWNFDALFIPQQHPARDIQDTFYVKGNEDIHRHLHEGVADEEYEKVRREHANAWKCPFSKETAQKPLFRTQTTAITARLIRELARRFREDRAFKGGKYFSIDKVFRNKSLDATHLAEFHQIEGVVVGEGISLAHILGLIEHFFKRIGIKDLKYKCTYNPYTEPSMEVFGYSKEMGKYVEIGNSGVFRREMLDPAGIPQNVNVIGWGLSLERPAMLMYGVKDIRDLCGNAVDLKLVRESKWIDIE